MESTPENPVVTAILGDVRPSKSVICSVLAFLEAIHEDLEKPDGPSPLTKLQEREVKGNGIVGQGRRVPNHLKRFELPTNNVTGDLSGRKTPQVRVIIPRLVSYLDSQGFGSIKASQKKQMLNTVSEPFRSMLGLSLGPIEVTPAGKTAAAVVEEILTRAEERGIVSAIAQLLVGSKLQICLGKPHDEEVAKQHKWDNGHDDPAALGDYRIENVAIEVTMVQRPDESHRSKANTITAAGTDECWLIVRSDKIKAWQDYIALAPSKYPTLIRCYGICEFVGQNLRETEWRSSSGIANPLRAVVDKLNELVAKLGRQFLPAARVELKQ